MEYNLKELQEVFIKSQERENEFLKPIYDKCKAIAENGGVHYEGRFELKGTPEEEKNNTKKDLYSVVEYFRLAGFVVGFSYNHKEDYFDLVLNFGYKTR